MSKALNLIVALFGITLLIGGTLKLIMDLDKLTFRLGDSYINLPLSNSLFFIITVNFIGGFALFYHALSTLNYKKELLTKHKNSELIDQQVASGLTEMSRPTMLTGSYSIIISLWFLLMATVIFSTAFKFDVMPYLELFIVATITLFAFGLLPIILVAKNISLSSKIRKIKERQKIALYHEKMKGHVRTRR